MSAVSLTKAEAKATSTCPRWCVDNHTADPQGYRHHKSREVHPTRGLYASIFWMEPRDTGACFFEPGPRICFVARESEILLTAPQASALAEVLEALDRDDAAAVLRAVVALVGGEGRG